MLIECKHTKVRSVFELKNDLGFERYSYLSIGYRVLSAICLLNDKLVDRATWFAKEIIYDKYFKAPGISKCIVIDMCDTYTDFYSPQMVRKKNWVPIHSMIFLFTPTKLFSRYHIYSRIV